MAAKAQGCKLWWSTDAFVADSTQVAGVTNVDTPSTSKGRIECTDLDDTTKTYLAGLSDLSSASYSVNYDGTNATHQALHVLDSSADVVTWKIEFQEEGAATFTTAVFLGYVDSFDASAGVDAKQDGTLVIQPTAGKATAHGATAEA